MPLKSTVLSQAWLQPVALLGVGRNCRGSSCRRKLGYRRNTLKGEIGALVSFCVSFCFLDTKGEQAFLHKSPSHHRLRAAQLRDDGQILKTVRKINLSSFKLLSQVTAQNPHEGLRCPTKNNCCSPG